MVKKLGKEVGIFLLILLLMAIAMHQGELPERIGIAIEDPAILSHSLMWAFLGYVAILVLRFVLKIVTKLFSKKTENTD